MKKYKKPKLREICNFNKPRIAGQPYTVINGIPIDLTCHTNLHNHWKPPEGVKNNMKLDLNIDNDPDKDIIKGLLPQMFNGKNNDYVYGWQTEKGTIITVITESKNTQREIVKKYFEEIMMETGKEEEEFWKIMDEIERGV